MSKYLKIEIVLFFILLCSSCSQENATSEAGAGAGSPSEVEVVEEFVPEADFKEAFEPIAVARTSQQHHDIEKTVQMLYALEKLQANTLQQDDFLNGLSKMRLEGVAKDVLKLESDLLAILQDMRHAEQQAGDKLKMTLYHSIINTARKVNNGMDYNKAFASATVSPSGSASVISKEAVTQAFDELEQYLDRQNEISTEFLTRMDGLKQRYMEHIAAYNEVFDKYMKEWDTLCIEKDRAYIDVYNGQFLSALNITEGILSKYPENRETLVLNALSAIMLGMRIMPHDSMRLAPFSVNTFSEEAVQDDALATPPMDYFGQAGKTLDKYLKLYPDYSAPALVLKGMLSLCQGKANDGISLLSKASIEYPRQTAKLTEMFELYSSRAYLNKTQEGKYVLKLYRSTMEGYGIFSPNFVKAGYYTQCGRDDDSRREIFNHFFRRGNQDSYHCLLSDMQFCNTFISGSFMKMLPENSFFDIETSKTFVGRNKINVSINNRTMIQLQNVRVFLCLHLTDMYPNEYEIVKVPSKNLIPPMQKTSLASVEINVDGKTYDDISHIRAIVMTDDAIFWVDNVDYKLSASQNGAKVSHARSDEKIDRNLLLSGFSKQTLQGEILDKIVPRLSSGLKTEGFGKIASKLTSMVSASPEKKWLNSEGKLKFEIPRNLMLLAPSFILKLKTGEMLSPEICYITDTKIRLMFDYVPKADEKCALYIYTKYASSRFILQHIDAEMLLLRRDIF